MRNLERPPDPDLWDLDMLSHVRRISGTAKIDDRGRLALPVELRRRLGLRTGDELRISEEGDGILRIESRQAAARALIGSAGRTKRSVVDELRRDRRRQTAAEDRDAKRHS